MSTADFLNKYAPSLIALVLALAGIGITWLKSRADKKAVGVKDLEADAKMKQFVADYATDANKRIADLESRLSVALGKWMDAENAVRDMTRQLAELTEQLEAAKQEIARLNDVIVDMEAARQAERMAFQAMATQLAELTAHNHALEAQLREKDTLIDELRRKNNESGISHSRDAAGLEHGH
jgi:chromosome segregation ATPase